MVFTEQFNKAIMQAREDKPSLHAEVSRLPFLARYNTPQITVLDHYRHLTQLLSIYQTLERKLSADTDWQFPDLLHHSKRIQQDLAFLKRYLPSKYQDRIILSSTQKYLNYLENASLAEIYGNALVRYKGDHFGGQITKLNLEEFFKTHKINGGGTYFYDFPNQLQKLHEWENKAFGKNMSPVVLAAAKNAFEFHKNIFDELETSRIEVKPIPHSSHCALFFKRVVLPAALLTAATFIQFRQ